MHRYSVVISPPDEVLEQVRQMKQNLKEVIGWYPSVSALAHISFLLFHSDADTLVNWETYIQDFAGRQRSILLRFDHTGSFPNGAFFLAPDANSERILSGMITDFCRISGNAPRKAVNPHMSLGRKLTTDQLAAAQTLLREVVVQFVCEDLVLRRFNPIRRQYDIYRRFPFYS